MRRRDVLIALGVVAAVVAALLLLVPRGTARPSSDAALTSAQLDPISGLKPPPKALFTRTMSGASDLDGSQALIDRCRGPVAIDLGDDQPVVVAEHDYCGGSAWIPKLRDQDVVRLDGPGVTDGSYVVSEIAYGRRGDTRVRDLPAGQVVAQTCVSPTRMVMVALDPVPVTTY